MSKKKTRHLLVAKVGKYNNTKYLGVNTKTGRHSWGETVASVKQTLEETREGHFNGAIAEHDLHVKWVNGKSMAGSGFAKVVMG